MITIAHQRFASRLMERGARECPVAGLPGDEGEQRRRRRDTSDYIPGFRETQHDQVRLR